MSAVAPAAGDAIEEYVVELTGTLHGPTQAKTRLIEEIRDGLADTAEALTHEGLAYADAVRHAVRDFGTPGELAPACQRELTIAQARHTARSVVLTAPLLIACWYTLLGTGAAAGHDGPLQRTAHLLAVCLAGAAGGAALLAAATLAATGALARRLPTPHRLPLVVAWAGTTTSVAMALAALTLAVAALMAANWPLIALACSLAAASHALTAPSARACRRVARLPA
ncbi:permease prefix domain 1-containing protein [Streptomyces vilmorinianum]|uniref:permease prefix domain 1-containing protein n=1 Tax=Streptomyces vilmorinianum TaxID=3051092 RepID=UPI0010FB82B4|nr:permease prefix domain 1-containing protein [Streptomyces vilmorinianum]